MGKLRFNQSDFSRGREILLVRVLFLPPLQFSGGLGLWYNANARCGSSMAWVVRDRWDNEITLTDERWQLIVTGHWELENLLDDVLDTLRSGTRKQHPVDPNKYRYAKKFYGLPYGYTHIFVIVRSRADS